MNTNTIVKNCKNPKYSRTRNFQSDGICAERNLHREWNLRREVYEYESPDDLHTFHTTGLLHLCGSANSSTLAHNVSRKTRGKLGRAATSCAATACYGLIYMCVVVCFCVYGFEMAVATCIAMRHTSLASEPVREMNIYIYIYMYIYIYIYI